MTHKENLESATGRTKSGLRGRGRVLNQYWTRMSSTQRRDAACTNVRVTGRQGTITVLSSIHLAGTEQWESQSRPRAADSTRGG